MSQAAVELNPTPLTTIDPVAVVKGDQVTELPKDLYIPPGAMKVFLEAFEGPLDLLLYLIKKQNIDILNIPIAEITRQYVQYVELMQVLQLELAAEYLVMAAMLAEIKSRMLLPKIETDDEEEEDPRAELVRRLQQYEQFKKAAEDLDALPQVDRDVFLSYAIAPKSDAVAAEVPVALPEVLNAFKEVMQRAKLHASHEITRELLSISDRMGSVMRRVTKERFIQFNELFNASEGRMGVVVTLIAILELVRRKVVILDQSEAYSAIYVKEHPDYSAANDETAPEQEEEALEYDN